MGSNWRFVDNDGRVVRKVTRVSIGVFELGVICVLKGKLV